MESAYNLRNALINKILAVKDQELLEAIDKLLSVDAPGKVELTEEQKIMLQMSQDDISNGKVIPQDELFERERKWLKGL